jgi:hypothetical protein
MPDTQTLFGAAATILAVYAYMPYFYGIYRGVTRPHTFTWGVGAIVTFVAFWAQMSAGAGPGAWMSGYTSFACFGIFLCSLRYFSAQVRLFDWVCLFASILTIFIWIATDSPFYAVILATLIDVVAFLPTVRKSWARPQDENIQMYFVNIFKFALSVPALQTINFTTALFPVTWVLVNTLFIAFLVWRRRKIGA